MDESRSSDLWIPIFWAWTVVSVSHLFTEFYWLGPAPLWFNLTFFALLVPAFIEWR
jgi:hypothetical protein